MNQATCAPLYLSLLLAFACEGVGRPLVDRRPAVKYRLPVEECGEAPCDLRSSLAERPPAFSLDPVVLDNCAAHAEPRPDLDRHSETVKCAALRWPIGALTAGLSQSGLKLRHSNLVIETTEPLEIMLDRAVFDDVWIALRGPATLRFSDSSLLTHVRVDMTPVALVAGEPRFALENSQASDLIVASFGSTHPGVATATRSRIDRGHMLVDEVVLESVVSDSLHVDAQRFSAFDCALSGVHLVFGEGLIASSELRATRFQRCNSATIAGSLVSGSVLSPCRAEPLRVYNTLIEASFVDGEIDSDTSTYQQVIFGANAPTALLAWDSNFATINLCKHTALVRFGIDSSFTCARCDGIQKQAALCKLQNLDPVVEMNACPVLEEVAVCRGPLPIRARPRPPQ